MKCYRRLNQIPRTWSRLLVAVLAMVAVLGLIKSPRFPQIRSPFRFGVESRRDGKFVVVDYEGPNLHVPVDESESKVGPGEMGSGVKLKGREAEEGAKAKKQWFMNLVASDKISLDRTLRDQRTADCRVITYDRDLPSASVVVVFTDEAWSPLLRTVHSIFNRTPAKYLHQVVLVDDFSQRGIGSFWWSLHYKMDEIQPAELTRRNNTRVDYLRTPTMAGGLFAVRRDTFFNFGAYDEEMDIWGGENLEISFRAWMCGGSVEIIPCSHVGHIYRNGHPYNMTGRGGNKDVHGTNSKRLAEVWMDDYKKFYYMHRSDLRKLDVGDLKSRHDLRKRLNCKSFKWFLENVAVEKFVLDENVLGFGRLKNEETKLCLDTLQRNEFKGTVLLGLYDCQYPGSSAQMFSLTNKGVLRRESVCLDTADVYNFPNEADHVQLAECPVTGNGRFWEFKDGTLRLTSVNRCLSTEGAERGSDVLLKPCDQSSPYQKWIFEKPDL